jgi:hypothetical protein
MKDDDKVAEVLRVANTIRRALAETHTTPEIQYTALLYCVASHIKVTEDDDLAVVAQNIAETIVTHLKQRKPGALS